MFALALSTLIFLAESSGPVRIAEAVNPVIAGSLAAAGGRSLTPASFTAVSPSTQAQIEKAYDHIRFADFGSNPTVTIGGRVTNVNGRGLSGIRIQIFDASSSDLCAASPQCTTDATGAYSFAVPAGGSYTVEPKDSRVSTWLNTKTQQNPIQHDNLTQNVTDDNFTAQFPSFTVAGAVKTQGGSIFPNQTVRLTGGATVNYKTDAQGKYTSDQLNVLGDYTFTPQPFTANGITYNIFSPANTGFVSMTTCDPLTVPAGVLCSGFNYTNVDFIAVPAPSTTTSPATSIAATTAILNGIANPNGLSTNAWFEWGTDPALATFNTTTSQGIGSGTSNSTITANLTNLTAGTTLYFRAVATSSGGTIRGSILNFTTSPTPRTLTVASANPASAVNITVSPNDINNGGNGTTQFTRTYNNNQVVSLTAPNSANGNSFQKWLKDGADFANNTIASVSVTMDADHSMTAVFLTPASLQFSTSTYNASEGDGFINIAVTRSGDTTGSANVSYATSNGTAKEGKDYTAAAGRLSFAPGEFSKSFPVLLIDNAFVDGARTVNLTLSSSAGAVLVTPSTAVLTINNNDSTVGSNPLDTPRSFVEFHYFDFLGRYPDQSGWDFWTNNITGCTPQPSCLEVQRINTSAAYFLSIEFQQTGYLVYRIYKASFGNLTDIPNAPVPIKFSEFLADTQEIGNGVIVNQGNWQQQLEANKQAFTLEFVQRPRFTAAFPTRTPAEFVDQLFSRAGVTPSTTDRNAALAEFGSASTSGDVTARSKALRDVAENATLNSQEFNKAFVLMQYFGYLRRNPYDPPEASLDYSGFNFWLNKLNQFNGDYIAAEMVKAFISSSEYRARFGP